jgi:homogentisate 1,2-dioxygenase
VIERMAVGELPRKHHVQLRSKDGALRWEECITQDGFEGPYTICYHEGRPHEQLPAATRHGWKLPEPAKVALHKRHYKTQSLPRSGGPPIDARLPLVTNADVTMGVAFPDRADPVYFADADADTLVFVHEGSGTLRTPLGDVRFAEHDYVHVPRSLLHRWIPDPGVAQYWLTLELHGGLHLPKQWRNPVGQLRMDAPYGHRDFRRPTFGGPMDESIRELVVKRAGAFHGFSLGRSPLDVVGWDGTVYPWAFPILAFQPRVSSVHLPPTWHGTFAARGALICSFVPRPVDFAPDAIPCPYPHASVDVDELLFYVKGNFTSRKGVGPGSISFHPAGIPHGPHPGSYEASLGSKDTNELAVMLDCALPLSPTTLAASIEDPAYMQSFLAG